MNNCQNNYNKIKEYCKSKIISKIAFAHIFYYYEKKLVYI